MDEHGDVGSPVLRALRRISSLAYHYRIWNKPSDCEIPLVPSPPVVRQSSLQRQTSAPDDDASTQRYLLARGGIRFWKNFAYESEARPFIRVRHDIDPDQVSGVLVHEWLFSAPRIALVLISHVGPLGGWADARRLGEFRRGLLRAANATPMWLLTNGFNTGIAKEVGDAVSHELRRRQALRCHKHPNRTRATLPPLRLLGIVREDMLAGAELLDGRQSEVQIENEGNRPDEGKYELNPDHSNYVLVRDDTVNRTGLNQFVMRLEQRFIKLSDQQGPTSASGGDKESGGGGAELPLIALLVSGGEGCARLVLEHLKRQLPVVVFEGSGGLADLLAFAYREVQRRSPAVWDAEFVEGFLKPELASMLCLMYPAYRENALGRNLLRDRVVESVRLACQSNCLTLVDIRSRSCDLTRLDEILLNAFFRAQRPERVLRYNQMKKDLMLTIDWNCPDVAMSQVFLKDPSCKFQVDRDIFEEALIRPGREEFVQMFLERGFRVHKYLTPRRLKQLFKKVQGEQFFRSVCWEGALGRSPFSKLGKHFVDSELNWLIETLTGLRGFVDSQELAMNAALGIYTLDPGAAERKALVLLALWCAFTQRTALGKRLWQCTDQPIHLALLVSMTYARLADLVHEGNTKKDLLDASEEFASMATGVLDCSYQEATCRAYDVLSEENPDWGHRTAVDIAARANNHKFLAHPCCQRWITNLFMGRISVRDLTWGPLAVPLWLKIILCAFLVFPMYIWVRFKSDPHEMEYKEEPEMEEEKDEREGDDEALLPDGFRAIDMQEQPPVPALTSETKVSFQPDAMTTLLRDRELFVPSPPPLWNMIYQMWNAPITKFWTFQIFYIAYLALFSVAVLLPSCGNRYVDMAVCAWTALIALESARRTYVLYTRYRDAPVFLRSVEVVLIAAFVAVYLVSRVLGPTPTIISAYGIKVVLCAALLGFYYRQIVIYLPISPTLGPLLYKVRLMVAEDFVNFMRMALLVIISGGIVAHALLYPDYPFNLELLRRTFHRAWFSLFLTPISDLEGDPRCLRLKVTNRSEEETCRVSDYTDYTCTNPGVWPYLFVIQFLVLLKLVLLTLLYALFSHTAHKIEAASDDIWKFQRYKLVVDFMNRLCLPPPLNIFSYLIALLQFVWRIISCRFCRTSHQLDGHADLGKSQLRLSEKDYNYWKHLASQYSQRLREEHDLEDGKKKQLESLSFFLEDMDHQRQMLSLLRGQIQELQRTVGKSFSYLQTLKHAADRPGEPGTVLPGAVHVLSRQSPYPRTRVLRYPVPDKYVAWQVLWLEYDPVAYSRPRADFPGHLQTHVDEDILGLRLASDGSGPLPSFAWNSVSTSPAGVSINRQSWIRDADGEQIIYRLDPQGMPMNPVGRTGLRGRGALPRWGPNHYVLFIITRWQRAKVHLVGGKGLEVVLMRVFRTDHFSLPGDFVPGEDKYATLKLLFKPETLSKCDTEEDVKQFFRGCHVEEEGVDDPSVEIRQRGYMDDPMNTDHCWREIELWNVHYHGQDTLLDRMQNHLLWRLVTEDLFTKLPLGQSVLLHEVTKMLQASII